MSVPHADAAVAGPGFVAGDVFAGRYRMVTLLGRTGNATVWHAHDLVLQTDIALKVILSFTEEDRERMLAQVRLTRQIAHPAVRRVFDVGTAAGAAFCSMELVRGEALGALLKRVGRLPSERVAEIGEQLCDVLAASHATGIIHGDVRPENILIDEHGLVRLTDFSAGGPSATAQGAANPYLAPEVRAGGTASEHSDIYAAGVVLYELMVGQTPSTPRIRPSALIDDVDTRLERVIVQALHDDPRRRPASAAAVAAQLASGIAPVTRLRWSPWLAGITLALVVGVAAALIAWLVPQKEKPPPALTDRDTIVIADFVNTTGEPVFDGALKVALAVALEQSPFLKIFPEERVHETLRLMQRTPQQTITRATARDIARRERLRALVAGSIARLGTLYVITVEAVDADNGDVMAREQVQAENREEVLTSLGQATASLRAKLGESLSLVRRFDAPLPQATTPSLEALHAYSLALDQGRVNPREDAIPHLKRAIELDPGFAMAQALLSGVYTNTGRFAEAPAYSRKAFELRERVSERERFMISWRYYVDAAQAWDEALDLAVAWTTTYPREPFAFNSLGLASAAVGDHERAVTAFRRAIELDPGFVPPYPNLVGSLVALDRFDEARAFVKDSRGRGIETTGIRRNSYVLAFLGGDAAAMASELAAARTQDAPWPSIWEARAAAAEGRFAMAHELFQGGIRTAHEGGLRNLAAQWTAEDAEAHAAIGRCADAQREAESALAIARDNFTIERVSRTFALCGAGDRAAALSRELTERFPEATLTHRIQLPLTTAALAVHRNDGVRALAALNPLRPYDRAPSTELWSPYLRGLAYLQTRNASAATTQFQEIVAHRGAAPTSPLIARAHLGAARAAADAGDTAQARRSYDAFLQLWAAADPDVDLVAAARRESAQLR